MQPAHFHATPIVRSIRLASACMALSGPWRAARALSVWLAFCFTSAVVYLAAKGHGHEVHSVVSRAAVWIAWLAGTILAWWAAGDRASVDRKEGIESLARIHGIDATTLAWGRTIAATCRVAALVGLATLPVAVASMASSPSLSDGLLRLLSLLPLGGFCLGVGLTAGALACACGWLSPERGRAWLLSLVVIPWALDGVLVGARANVASLPGMLGFLADLATRVGGGG